MNPYVQQFVEQFERDAALSGTFRAKLGKAELAFLEQVWGPAFQYDFAGLKAEYPFKDFKGGQRYADFVYIRSGMKLVIEIDGFSTHARDVSPAEFEDHLMRQNDLILSGWLLLRFSANQVFHPAVSVPAAGQASDRALVVRSPSRCSRHTCGYVAHAFFPNHANCAATGWANPGRGFDGGTRSPSSRGNQVAQKVGAGRRAAPGKSAAAYDEVCCAS